MKKVAFTFMLVFSATAANAGVINLLSKKSPSVANPAPASIPVVELPLPVLPLVVALAPTPPVPQIQPPVVQPPVVALKKFAIAKVSGTPAPIPEQHIVFLTEETRQLINEIVNCVDVPKEGGHDNLSAVPVPAALPLMATALGIFGITRRRKAFK